MHNIRVSAVTVGLLIGIAPSVFAQSGAEPPAAPLPSRAFPITIEAVALMPFLSDASAEERATELEHWMDAFAEWQEWSMHWRGKRQQGWFTGFQDRREKPAPPEWLSGQCVTVIDESDPLMPACGMLAEWSDDAAAEARLARTAAMNANEDTSKTIWWEHLHLDVLWPAMQFQGGAQGVIGMHMAINVHGRFEIFAAPGAMMLNLPTTNGSRVWRLATNYGFGYRLFDFKFPGVDKIAVAHLNLAKGWVVTDYADLATGRSMDFIGFSITYKKTRSSRP
jgi:hypothetical protein